MKTQQLICFIEVAKTKNYTKAAKNLFFSQPTVSYNISELERELGVALFSRSFNNNAIELTEHGKLLYDTAVQFVEVSEECDDFFEKIRELQRSTVSLVCSECLLYSVIPELVRVAAEGLDTGSPVNLKVFPAYSVDSVEKSINDESADFALYTDIPTENVSYLELFETKLWAYIPADHPLSSRSSVTLRELEPLSLLLPSQSEHKLTQCIEKMLENEKMSPVFFDGSNNIFQDRLACVSIGQCYTISTDWCVNSRYISKIPIDNPDNSIPIYAIWQKNKLLSEEVSKLIRHCEKFRKT